MKKQFGIIPHYILLAITLPFISASHGLAQTDASTPNDSLTLDHSNLVLGPPGAGKTLSLKLNTLTLINGAKIITSGNQLRITAAKIVSHGGEIISFLDDKLTPPNAADGTPGVDGLNGGTVELNASKLEGRLVVSLPGQNGGRGGRGAPGTPGTSGARGSDAADHLFDCASGGGNGSPGGNGGPGSQGQPGGNGGNGGKLLLGGALAKESDSIAFTANGGNRGVGGPGGYGGPPGRGGLGGSGSVHCSGGSPGQDGQPGPEGPVGPSGQKLGEPGSKSTS